jgi:hypothetical protein
MSAFKKNTAVTGFTVGLISATDGSDITTGTPAAYVTLDGGTQTAIAGSLTHEGNGQWSFNLTAAEMNGDFVGVTVTHTSAITVQIPIKTVAKTNDDLQDITAADVNAQCDTAISDAALATAAALATVDSNVDAILVDSGTTIPAQITALNNLSAAEVNAECDTAIADASLATAAALATIDDIVDSILVDTGTTLPAQITALNDVSVADVLTTQMTESYAADGTAPTLAQALFLIQQSLGDFSIAGTTITVKELDGSTTAATYTLDDGTSPTSRTRAS